MAGHIPSDRVAGILMGLGRGRHSGAALLTGTALSVLCFSLPAFGDSVWTGGASSDWFDPGNWSSGVPTSGDFANIDTDTPNATVVDRSTADTGMVAIGYYGTGALTVVDGGTLASSVGYIALAAGSKGSGTVTGRDSTWTVGGNLYVGINGTGALTVADGGAVSSAGHFIGWSSTGTGVLTVADGGRMESAYSYIGTLPGSDGAVTVTGPGSIWNNGLDLAVGISGTGALTVANGAKVESATGFVGWGSGGVGTATVTGTGSTWTNGSVLYVGGGGTGALTLAEGGRVSADGGAGTIVLADQAGGTGTLSIGAASGQAAVAAGTLDAGTVAFGGGTGRLVFNHSGATTFTAALSSTGTGTHVLDHQAGDTTLRGDNSGFAGTTTVSGGRLVVANALGGAATVTGGGLVVNGVAGDVNVPGGYLGGSGTVGATTVGAGGGLSPGNSIGTITVNGSLTFDPGSTYRVEVSSTGADRTNVAAVGGAGTADLSGATVIATYEPDSYVAGQHVIVSAEGGLGGTEFARLSGTAPAGFRQTLSYDANRAFLDLTLLMSGWSGLTGNQTGVADVLTDYFLAKGGIPAAYAFTRPGELTLASAENGTAAQQAGLLAADQFLSAIGDSRLRGTAAADDTDGEASPSAYAEDGKAGADRIAHRFEAAFATGASAQARAASTRSAWGSVTGGGEWLAGNAAVGSQDSSTALAGIASGIDWQAEGTRAGLALAAAWSNASLANGLGSASDGAFSIGARASHDFGGFYLSGAAAYGLHVMSTSRAVGAETYRANFTGQSFSGRAEAGARLSTGVADFLPHAAFQATAFSNPAYGETGSGAGTFALNYAARTTTETRGELGLRLSRRSVDEAGATTLSGRLAWAHYFDAARTTSAGFAALAGTGFLTSGAAKAADTALVSLDYRRDRGNKAVSLGLDGEFGAGTVAVGAKAGLSIGW